MTAPLLLHVGYHKTATTWMQRSLFVPAHGYRPVMGHEEAWALLVRPHGLRFDPGPARALLAGRLAGLAPGEVPVVSSEILSGLPFQGGRESEAYAARLREVAPEARILVSIRAQLSILPSVYMQYVRRGGTMTPAAFFAGEPGLGYFGFSPEHFEYDALVARYQDLFGAANVFVLPQEALRRDLDGAAAALARFAGNGAFAGLAPGAREATGASDPEHAVPVLRRINHVRATVLNPAPMLGLGQASETLFRAASWALRRPAVAALLGDRRAVTAEVRRRFTGRFEASNARLAALCAHPIDLSSYP